VCPVGLEPPSVVFYALETFVGYVGPQGDRAHTRELGVRVASHSEEGFCHPLVGGTGGPKAEPGDDPGGVCGGEQAKALVPSEAVGPSDVGVARKPSMPSTLTVPDGHRRAVQCLIGALSYLQKGRQMQDESLDELCVGAYAAVELGAVWQGGEGRAQAALRRLMCNSGQRRRSPDRMLMHQTLSKGWCRDGSGLLLGLIVRVRGRLVEAQPLLGATENRSACTAHRLGGHHSGHPRPVASVLQRARLLALRLLSPALLLPRPVLPEPTQSAHPRPRIRALAPELRALCSWPSPERSPSPRLSSTCWIPLSSRPS
jgi:hypothetical protein